MAEASDRLEDDEECEPEETLEDFRMQVRAENDDERLNDSSTHREGTQDIEEETEPEASAAKDEMEESTESQSEEGLEEFRRIIRDHEEGTKAQTSISDEKEGYYDNPEKKDDSADRTDSSAKYVSAEDKEADSKASQSAGERTPRSVENRRDEASRDYEIEPDLNSGKVAVPEDWAMWASEATATETSTNIEGEVNEDRKISAEQEREINDHPTLVGASNDGTAEENVGKQDEKTIEGYPQKAETPTAKVIELNHGGSQIGITNLRSPIGPEIQGNGQNTVEDATIAITAESPKENLILSEAEHYKQNASKTVVTKQDYGGLGGPTPNSELDISESYAGRPMSTGSGGTRIEEANQSPHPLMGKTEVEKISKSAEQSPGHPSKESSSHSEKVVETRSDAYAKSENLSRPLSERGYAINNLLRHLDSHKPRGFENVSLQNENGELKMTVDNSKFALREAGIAVRSSGPELLGKLESTERTIRFQFNESGVIPKLGSFTIKGMEASQCTLSIRYQRANKEHIFAYQTVSYERGKPVIEQTLQRRQDGRLTFTIPRSLFLTIAQKDLEVGKKYEIHGSVDEEYSLITSHFETRKSAKTYQIHLGVGKYHHRLSPGARHKIVIDSIDEKQDFNVGNGSKPTIFIGRTALRSMGFREASISSKDAIVEFLARNAKSNEEPKRYFTKLRPKKGLDLQADRMGAKSGDAVQITEIEPYQGNFLDDFNACRPKNFENIKLGSDENGFSMSVGSTRIPLRSQRMTTENLRLRLTAEIGDTKTPIRFYFDGGRVEAKIGNHSIREIKASGSRLSVSYQDSEGQRTLRYRKLDAMVFSPREAGNEPGKVARPMNAQERALWEDAEGSFSTRGYAIKMSQKFIEPLLDYCEGARRDGLTSRIYRREPKKTEKTPNPSPYYEASVSGAEDVAKEIALTEGLHRHPGRIEQIERVKEELKKTKSRHPAIRHAREILGLK